MIVPRAGAALVSGWPPIGELRSALPPGSVLANVLQASTAAGPHAPWPLAGQLPRGPRRSWGPHRRTMVISGRRGPPTARADNPCRGAHGRVEGENWSN